MFNSLILQLKASVFNWNIEIATKVNRSYLISTMRLSESRQSSLLYLFPMPQKWEAASLEEVSIMQWDHWPPLETGRYSHQSKFSTHFHDLPSQVSNLLLIPNSVCRIASFGSPLKIGLVKRIPKIPTQTCCKLFAVDSGLLCLIFGIYHRFDIFVMETINWRLIW